MRLEGYLAEAKTRTEKFRSVLAEQDIPFALITDESSIAYLAGFWGYLGVEFGRPTLLVVWADRAPTVITPSLESEMVEAMTWVEDVRSWFDFGGPGWAQVLSEILPAGYRSDIWCEVPLLPGLVRAVLDDQWGDAALKDVSPLLGAQRMIKSPLEIDIMRRAGDVAAAMMGAAETSLAEGVPEYESALAILQAGTRKAAGFLTGLGWERFVSPVIHNLQIMQSGPETSMVHRRASVRAYELGDPVYFCFCTLAQFKHYRLGFDRMFFVGQVSDDDAKVQEAAVAAQQAALSAIKAGVTAASVAEAANAVYADRGYETGYRTGRSIGTAYLEAPELKAGDKTILAPGMTFAVDGGISVDGRTAGRTGDSIVVTEDGFDYLTDYPRGVLVAG